MVMAKGWRPKTAEVLYEIMRRLGLNDSRRWAAAAVKLGFAPDKAAAYEWFASLGADLS